MSTIAAAMAITVTSSAGTAVHAISRPVCPWIGGPSVSSSGRARNFTTENRITATTTAKMKMQIPVASQKVKSMRSRCSAADGGSQGMSTATTVVAAATMTATTASWTI